MARIPEPVHFQGYADAESAKGHKITRSPHSRVLSLIAWSCMCTQLGAWKRAGRIIKHRCRHQQSSHPTLEAYLSTPPPLRSMSTPHAAIMFSRMRIVEPCRPGRLAVLPVARERSVATKADLDASDAPNTAFPVQATVVNVTGSSLRTKPC